MSASINPGDVVYFNVVTYEGKEITKIGAVTNMKSPCGGRIVMDGKGVLYQKASSEIVKVINPS